jgi:hypothetical protein
MLSSLEFVNRNTVLCVSQTYDLHDFVLCNFDVHAVDAMQSLFKAWSNTATNSFSYNLPGWSNRVGFDYPCFEKTTWQGVVCLYERSLYNGTIPIFLTAVHYM